MTLLQEEYQRRLTVPSDIVQHLPGLHNEVLIRSKPVVVELGVRTGNSTVALLAAVEKSGGKMYSVDFRTPKLPGCVLQHKQWHFIEGDDLAVRRKVPSEIDVLFIDTSHEMIHTLAELVLFVPRVKCGGVVLLHDTELEDVKDCPYKFPVAKALDDYCSMRGLTWTNTTGCFGLGRLEVA